MRKKKEEGTAILGKNQAQLAREHLNIFIFLGLSTLNTSKRVRISSVEAWSVITHQYPHYPPVIHSTEQ